MYAIYFRIITKTFLNIWLNRFFWVGAVLPFYLLITATADSEAGFARFVRVACAQEATLEECPSHDPPYSASDWLNLKFSPAPIDL